MRASLSCESSATDAACDINVAGLLMPTKLVTLVLTMLPKLVTGAWTAPLRRAIPAGNGERGTDW